MFHPILHVRSLYCSPCQSGNRSLKICPPGTNIFKFTRRKSAHSKFMPEFVIWLVPCFWFISIGLFSRYSQSFNKIGFRECQYTAVPSFDSREGKCWGWRAIDAYVNFGVVRLFGTLLIWQLDPLGRLLNFDGTRATASASCKMELIFKSGNASTVLFNWSINSVSPRGWGMGLHVKQWSDTIYSFGCLHLGLLDFLHSDILHLTWVYTMCSGWDIPGLRKRSFRNSWGHSSSFACLIVGK